MDIKQFDVKAAVEKGFVYTVKVPYGENAGDDSDMTLDVYGVGSKAFEDASAAIDAYQNKCWSKNKPVDKEHLKTLNIDLIAACVRGWTGIEEDGKAVPFNRENTKRVFNDYPWLAEQAVTAIGNVSEMLEKK